MRELSLAEIFKTIRFHTEDMFDRIEVAYWWLTHHHAGQWSQSYAAMCRLGKIYKPGVWQSQPHNHYAYNALCDAAGCDHEPMESFGA